MSNIKLSEMSYNEKINLAYEAGYRIKETNRRYMIEGADKYIENDFRSINEIMFLIAPDLKRKGFVIAA